MLKRAPFVIDWLNVRTCGDKGWLGVSDDNKKQEPQWCPLCFVVSEKDELEIEKQMNVN